MYRVSTGKPLRKSSDGVATKTDAAIITLYSFCTIFSLAKKHSIWVRIRIVSQILPIHLDLLG